MEGNGKTGTKKSQGYKNAIGFKLRYKDDKIKLKNNVVLDRLCTKCFTQVKWKLEYGKYKPLKQPARCNQCRMKRCVKPYRNICNSCADTLKACSKCQKVSPYHEICDEYEGETAKMKKQRDIDNMMKMMLERSRRTVKRLMTKEEVEWKEDKFVYCESGDPLVGIQFQKKFYSILGIEEKDDDLF